MAKQGPAGMAQSIERAAAAWKKEGLRAGQDKRVINGDVSRLTTLAKAVRNEDYTKASRLVDNMDTLIQDQIPVKVFNKISKVAYDKIQAASRSASSSSGTWSGSV